MNNTKTMLDKEIESQLIFMSNLDQKSEEYEKAVKNLEALYNLKMKEEETKEGKTSLIDKCISYGIQAAGIVLPLCFYSKWMKRGLEFETTGTFTSQTFKGLFSKFKPTGLK